MFIVAQSNPNAPSFVPHHNGCPRGFYITPASIAAAAAAAAAAATEQEQCQDKKSNSCATPSTDDVNDKKKIVGSKCNKKSVAFMAPKLASTNANANKTQNHVITERSPVHHNETNKVATISIDVTGYNVDDLKISIDDDHIVTVDGRRTNKLGDTYVIHRRFKLDKNTADKDKIEVRLVDGILDIVVPKKSVTGPRLIPITTKPSSDSSSLGESIVEYAEEEKKHNSDNNQQEDDERTPEEKRVPKKESSVVTIQEDEDDKDGESSKHSADSSKNDETWEDVTESA